MRTKLEAIGNKARVYAEHVGRVSYEDEIEEFLRVDVLLVLAVARAVAELPPGFLYSLAKDMRRRGGQVEMQLADAIEAVAKAIAPLLEEVRE